MSEERPVKMEEGREEILLEKRSRGKEDEKCGREREREERE